MWMVQYGDEYLTNGGMFSYSPDDAKRMTWLEADDARVNMRLAGKTDVRVVRAPSK